MAQSIVMRSKLVRLSEQQALYLWGKCGEDAPKGLMAKLFEAFGGKNNAEYQKLMTVKGGEFNDC